MSCHTDVLSPDESRSLLEQFNTRYDSRLRYRCMIRLMLETGIRPGEVTSLSSSCLQSGDTGATLVFEDAKSGDTRRLWIEQATLDMIDRWRDRAPDSEYLFPTRRGTRVQTRQLREAFTQAARDAGIDRADELSPKSCRHTFATRLYETCGNIRTVQQALGHDAISSTMVYVHVDTGSVREALQACSVHADASS